MQVSKVEAIVSGEVLLPASKSISNRLLIIKALCNNDFAIQNLSEASDTQILDTLLTDLPAEINAMDGGSTMRFLCALLAGKQGEWALRGTERAHTRPIGPLVDALAYLGAQIEYLDQKDYPPLHIKGTPLYGGTVKIPADISSQFVSALLLVGPTLPGGLGIILEGQTVSAPYIDMTLKLMGIFEVETVRRDSEIDVLEMPYQAKDYQVEADWTSASYFYELLALAEGGDILLPGLREDSLQGDQAIIKLMEPLGVRTVFSATGVQLSKGKTKGSYEADLKAQPDLAQTLIVTCAGLGIPAKFKGLETLSIKETDRLKALSTELRKLGVELSGQGDAWELKGRVEQGHHNIQTYQDHRMAMSFAPLAIMGDQMDIADPEVVSKSFPDFWDEPEKLGFKLS